MGLRLVGRGGECKEGRTGSESFVSACKEPAGRSGPPAQRIFADTEGLRCGAAYFFLAAAFFAGFLALAAGFLAVVFLAIRVVLLPGNSMSKKIGQQRPPATFPDEVAQQHHAHSEGRVGRRVAGGEAPGRAAQSHRVG
jgi:hypothetical protein